MVGSAVTRALHARAHRNVLLAERAELDLRDQRQVFDFFADHRPAAQVICAAVVGGIQANADFPGDFIGQNLMVQTNLLEAARRFGCADTVFLGSTCIYPREAPVPIAETQLLSGPLEPTNRWYAVAKLAGITMGQGYRSQFGMDVVSLLPCNLYGPGDSFAADTSHVIPGLMRRFHEAKLAGQRKVGIWGSGCARREFLHVDDLASAVLRVLFGPSPSADLLNVGSGGSITIADLAAMLQRVTGFGGAIEYDASRPDGAPNRLLDSARMLECGWRPTIELEDGLVSTYQWFVASGAELRAMPTLMHNRSANAR